MYQLKYRVTKINDKYENYIVKVSIQLIYHDAIQSPNRDVIVVTKIATRRTSKEQSIVMY